MYADCATDMYMLWNWHVDMHAGHVTDMLVCVSGCVTDVLVCVQAV